MNYLKPDKPECNVASIGKSAKIKAAIPFVDKEIMDANFHEMVCLPFQDAINSIKNEVYKLKLAHDIAQKFALSIIGEALTAALNPDCKNNGDFSHFFGRMLISIKTRLIGNGAAKSKAYYIVLRYQNDSDFNHVLKLTYIAACPELQTQAWCNQVCRVGLKHPENFINELDVEASKTSFFNIYKNSGIYVFIRDFLYPK
jgi:hypothetical protein